MNQNKCNFRSKSRKDVHIHYEEESVESRVRSCASKGSEAGLHRNRGICFRFPFTT